MQEFLKKYSTVPKDFINDFFGIAKESYNDTDFVIDVTVVIKWLKTRKDHIKKILVDNFEEKYDFTISKIKRKNANGKGTNYVDVILLTPNCFKELCMISQTAKAKEVRKYYIAVEKLMKKYHEAIEENLNKKLGIIKKNQKPKIDKSKGIIYILPAQNDANEDNLYKLGKSKKSKTRFNTYNSGNANNIEPLFIMECDNIDSVENCVKNLVKGFQYRKRKEIYEIDHELLSVAIEMCDDFVSAFDKFIKQTKKSELNKKIKELKKKNKKFLILFEKN